VKWTERRKTATGVAILTDDTSHNYPTSKGDKMEKKKKHKNEWKGTQMFPT
jgi:hypothetical protein